MADQLTTVSSAAGCVPARYPVSAFCFVMNLKHHALRTRTQCNPYARMHVIMCSLCTHDFTHTRIFIRFFRQLSLRDMVHIRTPGRGTCTSFPSLITYHQAGASYQDRFSSPEGRARLGVITYPLSPQPGNPLCPKKRKGVLLEVCLKSGLWNPTFCGWR